MPQTAPSPSQIPLSHRYASPTIHLNGTGAQALADEYRALWQAAERAMVALSAATCNVRDFYPQGSGAFDQARLEREMVFRKLAEVQAYAQSWMEASSAHL